MTHRCERNVGDPGPCEPYQPCGKPAPFVMARGPHGGGPEHWAACAKHALEAKREGAIIDGDDHHAFAGLACSDEDGTGTCEECGVALVACPACDGIGYHVAGCARSVAA